MPWQWEGDFKMQLIFQNTELNKALSGGFIHRESVGIVNILIWQNMMFIASTIADKDYDLNIKLPQHEPFYIDIKNEYFTRRVKIDKDKNLEFKLYKDESFSVITNYGGR